MESFVGWPEDSLFQIYKEAKPVELWTPFAHIGPEYDGKEWPELSYIGGPTVSEKVLQQAWNNTFASFEKLGPTWSLHDTHDGTYALHCLCSLLETTSSQSLVVKSGIHMLLLGGYV